MKKNKIISIIVALLAMVTSCKKENVINSNDKNRLFKLSMDYYGEKLEYSVNYNPITQERKVEGKDANRVSQILNQAPNGVIYFKSENEIYFFNNKLDFYAYGKNEDMKNVKDQRVSNTNNSNIITSQNATVRFYRHTNYVDQMDVRTVDQYTPVQSFVLYYNCGSNINDNWCTNGVPNIASGFKVASVPSGTNDNLSSFKIESPLTHNKDFWLVLFMDGNFSGRTIAFKLDAYQQVKTIPDLTQWRRVGWFNGSWNDQVSSYQGYYYAY